MKLHIQRMAKNSLLLGLIALAAGCIIVPSEGYYDRDHHRYYHERSWHECGERGERDERCR